MEKEIVEEWEKIEGFKKYEISNIGRVRTKVEGKWKYIKPYKNGNVKLRKLNGGMSTRVMYKLMAIAFIENINCYKYVSVKDGNKSNYNLDNLEWVARTQKMIDGWKINSKKGNINIKEEWKSLEGFEKRYVVSNYGKIRDIVKNEA